MYEATVRAYLDCDANAQQTAALLHIHRTTGNQHGACGRTHKTKAGPGRRAPKKEACPPGDVLAQDALDACHIEDLPALINPLWR